MALAGIASADTGSTGSVTDAARAVLRVMGFDMVKFLLSVEILWRLQWWMHGHRECDFH